MSDMTPMMKQYLEMKEQYKGCILFFRLGDFYEMFFDDAKEVSRELELTLTGRDCGQKERAPMCGIPYHSSEAYIARLIEKGYKVAICEQMEDPATAKGLVKRDVVRIITPGTVVDSSMLEETKNNFLCAVFMEREMSGICFADVSTGEVYATAADGEEPVIRLINELGRFSPSEVLLNEEAAACPQLVEFLQKRLHCTVDVEPSGRFDDRAARSTITGRYGPGAIDEAGLSDMSLSIRAAGALLSYLAETQRVDLAHLTPISCYQKGQYMELDIHTRRNLELTETMRSKEKRGSLLGVLDRTKTAMGGRLLRKWLEQPLSNCVHIKRRQNAVGELVADSLTRGELIDSLSGVYDLERLMTRVVYGTANGRDLRALWQTFQRIPGIREMAGRMRGSLMKELFDSLDELSDLRELIDRSIVEEPPFSIREGGMIRAGYSEQADELHSLMTDGKGYIARIESEEKERTGIRNLKIGYNKVFGYYIEVTKSNYDSVPEHYIRKQTLSNCERYITQELKELESRVLSAQERTQSLEYELFCEVRQQIAGQLHRISQSSKALAALDALCSLSEVASRNGYTCPEVDFGDKIEIRDGRHPVVESVLKDALFVPNDTLLDCGDNRLAIITGPNMAGKSTYMRQVAIITLMAQMGGFVPAASAHIGVVDKIFTRVGASDDLSMGQSTFMVEMSEVAGILKGATSKSLLIFDEIGRGTSTFDGMSIARAVVEYSLDKKRLGAKTLFATHYHELTALEEQLPGVKNYNIAVKKRGDDITFLRKIVRGGADDSYGIEVAKLAGVPDRVIQRAKEVLLALEQGAPEQPAPRRGARVEVEDNFQTSLGDSQSRELIEKLKKLDINTLTPLEAMNALFELKQLAGRL